MGDLVIDAELVERFVIHLFAPHFFASSSRFETGVGKKMKGKKMGTGFVEVD
jgi:hypothetical protein